MGPAVVFGAIMVVIGPTVILPLPRHARLERRSASFLAWKAIVNDPVGAILTAIVIEALVGLPHRSGEEAVTGLALHLAEGAVAATTSAVRTYPAQPARSPPPPPPPPPQAHV